VREAPLKQVDLTSPSGRLTAAFFPAMGGEMTSLTVLHGGRRREVLHRGGDLSPTEGWSGRAPHLWPVIGRTYPAGREPAPGAHKTAPLGWFVDDVLHPMPQHGFARALPWRLVDQTRARIVMVLEDSAATRACYPFGFALSVDAEIADYGVRLDYRVAAAPTNSAAMPFTLGNHATFRTPLIDGSSLGESRVGSMATLRRPIDGIGCPSGPPRVDAAFRTGVPLDAIPPGDVIVLEGFGDGSAGAWIQDPSGLELRVFHAAQGSDASVPSVLTLWGHPADGYLALEPWLGLPNALSSGDGVLRLAPGASMGWTIHIRLYTAETRPGG
jgi:galactose mutarotase-like enzyme